MRGTPFIVVFKPLSQIASRSYVWLFWLRVRLQQINVMHQEAGLPAVAWCFRAVRLRKASAHSLQPSPCAALQAKAGAGDEARTRDVLLGKEVLYH